MSLEKHLTTTKYAQKETVPQTKCGRINGMFHPDNPLAHAELDEEPYDLEMYGHDPHGPSSVGSDNNVIVEVVHLPHDNLLT